MKIEFVDYDGTYPNLCSGHLILRIDGEIYSFGGYIWDREDQTHEFPRFWSSGGYASWDPEEVGEGDWYISDEKAIPEFLKGHEEELIAIMNANVPHGCCGGCI